MPELEIESPAGERRRNASGESTRVMLMEVAERLFATRGIEAVTLKEIQQAAGQSNTSVIRYHFGSRDNLIRALIAYRQTLLCTHRHGPRPHPRTRQGTPPRALAWLAAASAGQQHRSGENSGGSARSMDLWARSDDLPDYLDDEWTQEKLEELVDAALQDLPERIRRGRRLSLQHQPATRTSLAVARSGRTATVSSEAELHN